MQDTSIDALIEGYSVLLFDAYGVLVSADGALPDAAVLIRRLNRINKPYYVLTNDASMLTETLAHRYKSFGLDVSLERIITAGSLLSGYFAERGMQGARCVSIGASDSAEYVRRAGGVVVRPQDAFDALVVCHQPYDDFLEIVDTAMSTLFRQIEDGSDPLLVLPNPDMIYPKSSGFGITSGSIALMLETVLHQRYPTRTDLRFQRLGKPNTALFQEAHRRSATNDMVMLGDTLATDIRGANSFGIHSALVTSGNTPADAVAHAADAPTYILRTLVSDYEA